MWTGDDVESSKNFGIRREAVWDLNRFQDGRKRKPEEKRKEMELRLCRARNDPGTITIEQVNRIEESEGKREGVRLM